MVLIVTFDLQNTWFIGICCVPNRIEKKKDIIVVDNIENLFFIVAVHWDLFFCKSMWIQTHFLLESVAMMRSSAK